MLLSADNVSIRTSRRTRSTVRRRLLTVELCERRDMLVGNFLDGVSLGDVSSNPINEASGLVASQQNTDVFWTHNDSGDSNRVFALNAQGGFLGSFVLQGAAAIDYEDIAIGKGPQSGVSYMYVADTGDNAESRSDIDIYRRGRANCQCGWRGSIHNVGGRGHHYVDVSRRRT